MLLAQGADVHQPEVNGVNPLMWAITNGGVELVRILLAHGADPRLKDDWGEDAFAYADDETVSNDTIRALLAEWKRRA